MPSSGTQFGIRQAVAHGSDDTRGLGFLAEKIAPDSCEFIRWTGTPEVPDITFTAGTQVLIPASGPASNGVPKGMKCYITSIVLYVSTAFTGGTAGTVSLTIQDTAGTTIATILQSALTQGAYITIPANSLPAGVTDSVILTLGPSTGKDQGVQILKANSTAGVARMRVRGYYAP